VEEEEFPKPKLRNPGTKTDTRYVYFWFRLRMGDAYVALAGTGGKVSVVAM
jgi:hypothetical protein